MAKLPPSLMARRLETLLGQVERLEATVAAQQSLRVSIVCECECCAGGAEHDGEGLVVELDCQMQVPPPMVLDVETDDPLAALGLRR